MKMLGLIGAVFLIWPFVLQLRTIDPSNKHCRCILPLCAIDGSAYPIPAPSFLMSAANHVDRDNLDAQGVAVSCMRDGSALNSGRGQCCPLPF